MRNSIKLTIILVLLAASVLSAAQSVDLGADAKVTWEVSPRWAVGTEAHFGGCSSRVNYGWGRVGVSGRFLFYKSMYVIGEVSYAEARFVEMDNVERIFRCKEIVCCEASNGLSHFVSLDQRRMFFKPSNYDVSCGRLSYKAVKMWTLDQSEMWSLVTSGEVVANVKSELSGTGMFQRMKVGVGVQRRLAESARVGVEYRYMFGGKRQTYMGDAHNLHRISLFWTLGK